MSQSQSHKMISYDKYGKLVYRLCSCISSVQKLNENSIKFSLSTQIRSRIKYLLLSFTKLQLSKRLAVQFPSMLPLFIGSLSWSR